MNALIERIQKYLDNLSEDLLGAMYDLGDEPKYISSFRIQARYRADALRQAIAYYTRNPFIQMSYSIHLLVFVENLGALIVQYAESEVVSEILNKISSYIFETVKDDLSNAQEIVETIIETLDWLNRYLDAFLEKMKEAWKKREEELSRS